MKKLFLHLALLFAIAVGARASTTWNLGGTAFTTDTLYHATVGPGITQTQLKVKNSSYSNNIIYTTIDLTTPNLEIRGVQAKDNGDVVENVRAMGDRKNNLGKGQYITGTNADFFNMGGSPTRTCGTSLVDSYLYNLGSAVDGWSSYAVVEGKKDITFSESVYVGYTAKNAAGTTHRLWVDTGRATNYLCLYTSKFGKTTGTNGWGSECAVKLVSGSLNSGNAVFEVTTTPIGNQGGTAAEGNMTIPSGGYVLSGVNDAFTYVKSLKIGDRISLSRSVTVDGKEINPTQIVGGCPLIVVNGQLAPTSNFGRIDHFSSRQARTAIGYNKDRTKLIMLVVDKFTTNNDKSKPQFGASAGLTMKMLAYVMMQLNCHTAMAFDGGGSSQLYVKGLGICNVPYGSTALRAVANGIFAVSTTPVDNTVAKIEVVQKNTKLSTGGKITPKVYGYNKYGVLVNTNLTGFKILLSSKVGSVSGTTITAGSGKYNTYAIITYGNARYDMPLTVNGGGTFVSSEPVVEPPKPALTMTEMWSRIDNSFDDGWDATAPDWSNPTAIKSKSCPRYATAMNGKFYTVNMRTMSIMEIDANGCRDVYKLPAIDGSINGVADYYGTAISHDDAGNFLVGHYFTKEMSSYVWTIYSPATGKSKTFTLPVPSGMKVGRIDCVGRVIGDLTRDAYVYIAPAYLADGGANQKVAMVHFSGSGDVSGVTATNEYSPIVYLANHNGSVCQPLYATIDELNAAAASGKSLSDSFIMYSKAAGQSQWSCSFYKFNNGVLSANLANGWTNYAGTNGFDTFVIDGKRYYVMNHQAAEDKSNTSPMDVAVVDESGNVVASWKNTNYKSCYGYSSVTAQRVNDKNVDIYVYNCTYRLANSDNGAVAVARLRVSADGNTGYPVPEDVKLTKLWSTLDTSLNDGWDATAPDWSSSTAIKAKPCPRFATAMNGKIYSVNMKTMSIMEFDANGWRDAYKLPALSSSINGVADYYGTAITHDDAGNFLIGHYFTKEMSSYVWTVYSPATGKAKTITLPVPSGMKYGRIDCVGRVAGDLTRNAKLFIAPAVGADAKVTMVTFTGNGDVDGVTATCAYSPAVTPLSSYVSVCQPDGTDGSFIFYSKNNSASSLYKYADGKFSANAAADWKNFSGSNGFDSFVLEGRRYYVVNYLAAADNSNTAPMDFAVLDENGNVLASWKNPDYKSCYGYSSIAVEPVDNVSVNIYVYNCTYKLGDSENGAVATAKFRFSIGESSQPATRKGFVMTEAWSKLDTSLNDGWDATAPNWATSSSIKAKECPRFATAMNGKIYSVNMKTMSIMEFDANGWRDAYKLPALSGSINGVADYYGTAISHDDAGNFLIGHYFTKEMSAYVWTVFSPATGKAKTITLPVQSGMKVGRIDCIGRVTGDLTRDARVYIAPGSGADAKVTMVTFTGDGDVDGISASCEYSPTVNPLTASLSICQPGDDFDSAFFYSKGSGACSLYSFTDSALSANYAAGWLNYSGSNGFDTFVLDGKRYFVINYQSKEDKSNTAPMDIAVVDEDGDVVASWKSTSYRSCYGYSSIVAEPVDEHSVRIYVYNCTYKLEDMGVGAVATAMLVFSDDSAGASIANRVVGSNNGTAAIEEITEEADENAEVEYFNLQGVRVVNPKGGIYIVRRGDKVCKEYIR